jgi:hypothetical protein
MSLFKARPLMRCTASSYTADLGADGEFGKNCTLRFKDGIDGNTSISYPDIRNTLEIIKELIFIVPVAEMQHLFITTNHDRNLL